MTPVPPSIAEAAHRALVEAARLGCTGQLVVARSATGVSARLEGVVVVVPIAAVRWGYYHTQALTALKAAAALQPLGAWEWTLTLRKGVPTAAGLTWRGLDGSPASAL